MTSMERVSTICRVVFFAYVIFCSGRDLVCWERCSTEFNLKTKDFDDFFKESTGLGLPGFLNRGAREAWGPFVCRGGGVLALLLAMLALVMPKASMLAAFAHLLLEVAKNNGLTLFAAPGGVKAVEPVLRAAAIFAGSGLFFTEKDALTPQDLIDGVKKFTQELLPTPRAEVREPAERDRQTQNLRTEEQYEGEEGEEGEEGDEGEEIEEGEAMEEGEELEEGEEMEEEELMEEEGDEAEEVEEEEGNSKLEFDPNTRKSEWEGQEVREVIGKSPESEEDFSKSGERPVGLDESERGSSAITPPNESEESLEEPVDREEDQIKEPQGQTLEEEPTDKTERMIEDLENLEGPEARPVEREIVPGDDIEVNESEAEPSERKKSEIAAKSFQPAPKPDPSLTNTAIFREEEPQIEVVETLPSQPIPPEAEKYAENEAEGQADQPEIVEEVHVESNVVSQSTHHKKKKKNRNN